MLTITINGERNLLERYAHPGPAIMQALIRKVNELAIALQTHIVRDYLSGQALQVRSGNLRRSITHDVITSGTSVIGKVFSTGEVKYAAIQNYGGTTRAHDIYPKAGNALAFMMGGRQVFAKVVHHPGSKIPAHPYMEPALADMRQGILDGMRQAFIEGVTGK